MKASLLSIWFCFFIAIHSLHPVHPMFFSALCLCGIITAWALRFSFWDSFFLLVMVVFSKFPIKAHWGVVINPYFFLPNPFQQSLSSIWFREKKLRILPHTRDFDYNLSQMVLLVVQSPYNSWGITLCLPHSRACAYSFSNCNCNCNE